MNKSNENIHSRLKKERLRLGFGLADVAEAAGAHAKTVGRWEKDVAIPGDKLAALTGLGFDLLYVLTGKRDQDAGLVKEAPGVYSPTADDDGEFVSIPEYDIDVAAGGGRVVLDEQPVGSWHFRRDWLRAEGLDGKDLITVIARGDSGEPKISDGDMLLVDRSVAAIGRDAVYIVGLLDHLVVKRVSRRFDKPGLILSSNNEIYPPIELDAETVDQLNVVGRVERVVRLGRP